LLAVVITVLVVGGSEPVVAAGAPGASDVGSRALAGRRDSGAKMRADLPPRTITISVRASPRAARILLDGREVPNPLKLQQPAHEGHGELQVMASGYKPQRFQVPLDRGGTWVIALQQDKSMRPGRRGPGRRPGKKPKKGKLGDNDVLDSPYE
jgi:hypothetical protein